MKQVRCAIYTRKSSEEGLEQGFNSLDAQREACAAYILSQASEGWTEVAARYDDGGLSGGTLDRPALQRLLADVAAGRIDIIVVYKVDRLTRSLLDFAKLVEAFDMHQTSFVSVTQSFNTTTSMGRLTLNMLLSFAQFEREVTAERIRDKIAASKARGMWMGGIPPIGYAPNGRTLRIIEGEARLIRHIFQRYLALGNVRLVAGTLEREGVIAPSRSTITGRPIGGVPFTRGQIHKMLVNPIYTGVIVHGEHSYPGLHAPIIDKGVWDQVQALLAEHQQGERRRTRIAKPSLLAGKVADDTGEPLIATHACKGKVRYRYYVSKALHHATSDTGLRIPAREIESVVTERVAQFLDDPVALAATAGLAVEAQDYLLYVQRARQLAAQIRLRDHFTVNDLITTVRVERGQIAITCSAAAIAERLQVALSQGAPGTVTLFSNVRLTRSGRTMRLIDARGASSAASPNIALVRLVAKAHLWWRELREGELDIKALAQREQVQSSYVTRVVRLAFLSPRVTAAILSGTQTAACTIHALTLGCGVAPSWREQDARLASNP